MAANTHWEVVTPSDPKITYFKTTSGYLWKIEVERLKWAKIRLVNGGDLSVASNNATVVSNDSAAFKITGTGNRRTIEFYCSYEGTTLIEAKQYGTTVAVLQVHVKPSNKKGLPSIVVLGNPNAALNSYDSPVKYKMDASYTISKGESVQTMLNRIPKDTKHLAISAHGEPGRIDIGEGISMNNVRAFSIFKTVPLLVIWIGGCSIAGNEQGDQFCAEMAKLTGCYIVAPAITLATRLTLQKNQIEVFSSNMPHYFTPGGIKINEASFFQKQLELGFKVI